MTKEQVKEVRTAKEPVVFNASAALLALKATPMKVARAGGGASSDLTKGIVECFKQAKGELSLNQVQAMYNAATKQNLANKVFADRCWTLSDKNKKNKAPLLKAGSAKGVYVLAK